MLETLGKATIANLQAARKHLAQLSTDALKVGVLHYWFRDNIETIRQTFSFIGNGLEVRIRIILSGHESQSDVSVLDALRMEIIKEIDSTIDQINKNQLSAVTPISEDVIERITDTKLSTMLRELNAAMAVAPNALAIAYRTIVSLTLRERARKVKPNSHLAAKEDIGFEVDLKQAIADHIFPEAIEKGLKRYVAGDKDSFDNVAHKAGDLTLVQPEDLQDAVRSLNTILRTIVEEA